MLSNDLQAANPPASIGPSNIMTSDSNTPPANDEPQNRLAEESPTLPSPRPIAPTTRRHPLQSFGLANFKAFGANEQTIPLRPITLVFGPNSGGKSSILHFLLWMKAVVEGKGLDVYFPIPGSSTVDLGGFKQSRHGNKPETEVSAKLEFSLKDDKGQLRNLKSVSTFAACAPPTDYTGIIRAMVSERFADVLTRNSFTSLLGNSHSLEYAVVVHVLQKLLAEDYGRFTVESLITDCWEGNEKLNVPWTTLRTANCPKLAQLYDPYRGLLGEDVPGAREALCREISEGEILAELQMLALAVFDALEFQAPPVLEMKPSLVRFELTEAGRLILIAARDEANSLRIRQLDVEWLSAFHCRTELGERSGSNHEALETAAAGLFFNDLTSWLPRKPLFVQEPVKAAATRGRLLGMLIGTPEIPGLFRLCQTAAEELVASQTYLGPLRAYPQRNITVADLPQTNDPEGLFAWRLLYDRKDVRDGVNLWLNQATLASKFEVVTDNRVGLRLASQKISEELHRRISLKQSEFNNLCVHYQSGHEESSHLYEAFEWFTGWNDLKWMEEATESARLALGSEASGIVYLKDQRSGKPVTCRDIGVGMSQLIPVLALAKAAQGEFIAIEESETHVHPALQAELGDVFIESALQRGNTFLLETHSEHLILRLLRRIRETTDGEIEPGKFPLRPSDICVLFVEPGENGSRIIELPVTPDGDFRVPWPGGFFAERATELFGPKREEANS